ncbi:MAG: bifunctional glutamate N-acetyltransferase/amino-acid acetyltransferase ArgJ [Polyangiales bacterium]|nr:bifunctional glutamate N-acetyltransferase/amino-acid acetyltransferase ArgJ [Myxococcales bacterium]
MAHPVVPGFRWSGIRAGIKSNGKPDLGLIVADGPVSAAAVFTRNVVRAAPVEVASERVRGGRIGAVLVNSGNANACTGGPGHRACLRTTKAVAKALQLDERHVFPASTGVIGHLLPADRIVEHVPALVRAASPEGLGDFSRAILTTDKGPKVAVARFGKGASRVTVVAVAKGAGMIHPDMATTLGFVATDASISHSLLGRMLRGAVDETFNSLSVDGDTSTNDTIVALASGEAGGTVGARSERARSFASALVDVLGEVGAMIVADGEGAEHAVRIEVIGAPSDAAATKVASTVAGSLLVKTALYGKDPNWGRLLAAAGRAGVPFDPARAGIRVGGVPLVRRGLGLGAASEARVAKVMRRGTYTIEIDLGAGKGRGHYLTCDVGHGYVNVNADYRT